MYLFPSSKEKATPPKVFKLHCYTLKEFYEAISKAVCVLVVLLSF